MATNHRHPADDGRDDSEARDEHAAAQAEHDAQAEDEPRENPDLRDPDNDDWGHRRPWENPTQAEEAELRAECDAAGPTPDDTPW